MKRALLALLLVAACRPVPYPLPPEADAAPPARDAGHDAAQLSRCERAWQHIQALNCTVTAPHSGSWTEACQNAEDNAIDMHTGCIVAALNCADVRICLGER